MEEVVVARMQAVEFARAILEARDAEIAFTLQVQESLRNYADFNEDVDDHNDVLGFGLDYEPPLVVEMQVILEEDRDAALRFSVQELGSLTEATEEFQSSLAEAARLAQLDSIQEHDAIFARSLANMPKRAWDSKGDLSSDPFNPNVNVEKKVPEVEDFDLVLELLQESNMPIPEKIYNSKTPGNPVAHTLKQAAKTPLENSILKALNNGKHKLVEDEGGNAFPFRSVNRSSLPSTSKSMEEADEDDAIGWEVCQICFESTSAMSPFFRVEGCGHRYCKSCNAKHAESRVQDGHVEVSCLHAGCPTTLSLAHLSELLSTKTLETLTVRQIETAIPWSERVYCPFQDCSMLLVKPDPFKENPVNSQHPHPSAVGIVECEACHRAFCMECRVPWHGDQSCAEYHAHLKNERLSGDQKLHQLVEKKKWKCCKKCGYVLELTGGCYHMTCRCGYSFCYTCGSPWLSQRTCSCKLWDESNL